MLLKLIEKDSVFPFICFNNCFWTIFGTTTVGRKGGKGVGERENKWEKMGKKKSMVNTGFGQFRQVAGKHVDRVGSKI